MSNEFVLNLVLFRSLVRGCGRRGLLCVRFSLVSVPFRLWTVNLRLWNKKKKTKPKSFDQKVPGPMSPGGSPGMLLSNALAKYFCNRFDLVHPKGETYKKYNLVCFAFWVDEIETAERRRETKRRRGTYTFTIAGSWKWFLIVCCLRKRYQPLDMWNWMFVLPECTAWGLDAYRMSIWKPMHLSRYWCVYCKCIVCNLVSSTLSYEAADHLCLNILCVCSHTYLYIHIAI